MYTQGQLVPRDLVCAYMWSCTAWTNGSELAEIYCEFLSQLLTPEQMTKALALVSEFESGNKITTAT